MYIHTSAFYRYTHAVATTSVHAYTPWKKSTNENETAGDIYTRAPAFRARTAHPRINQGRPPCASRWNPINNRRAARAHNRCLASYFAFLTHRAKWPCMYVCLCVCERKKERERERGGAIAEGSSFKAAGGQDTAAAVASADSACAAGRLRCYRSRF